MTRCCTACGHHARPHDPDCTVPGSRFAWCPTCASAAHAEEDCPQRFTVPEPEPSGFGFAWCPTCSSAGHAEEDCPRRFTVPEPEPLRFGFRGCPVCGGVGHSERDCPQLFTEPEPEPEPPRFGFPWARGAGGM